MAKWYVYTYIVTVCMYKYMKIFVNLFNSCLSPSLTAPKCKIRKVLYWIANQNAVQLIKNFYQTVSMYVVYIAMK